MKNYLPLLALLVLSSSCAHTVLIHSASKNPPGNETLVDKKTHSIISASNDQQGILINIRVPDAFDQYKILKYGGYLAINLQKKSNQTYVIAYPISNLNKSLRLPILPKNSLPFPMDSLLVGLSKEAGMMKIFNFYDRQVLKIHSKPKDSVAVDVFHEPGEKGALIYSAFIPYNAMEELRGMNLEKAILRISFTSGALAVHHIYGGGPAFSPRFTYRLPRTREERKLGIHPPSPDPKLVEKLAEPVAFDADLTLAVR